MLCAHHYEMNVSIVKTVPVVSTKAIKMFIKTERTAKLKQWHMNIWRYSEAREICSTIKAPKQIVTIWFELEDCMVLKERSRLLTYGRIFINQ